MKHSPRDKSSDVLFLNEVVSQIAMEIPLKLR